MFDTKIALIVRDDLATWQRLNVVAFPGKRHRLSRPRSHGGTLCRFKWASVRKHAGSAHARLRGKSERFKAAHRRGIERELTLVPYVEAMFSTGHDEANRRFSC